MCQYPEQPILLNNEIRKEWINELRSRKYVQGYRFLKVFQRISEKDNRQRNNHGFSTHNSTRESGIQPFASTSQTSPQGWDKSLKSHNCVLGVLAEIAVEQESSIFKWDLEKIFINEPVFLIVKRVGDKWSSALPIEIIRWAGMNNGKVCAHLTAMNDIGFTFEQIADAIEEGVLPAI